MIDYNELFDIAYSCTLSEAVKDSIIDNILESAGEELSESLQSEDSCYIALLSTLVNSTISEESMYDVIDMSFAHLSEEAINEVTDEWKKNKATEYVKRRQDQLSGMVKPQKSMLGTDKSPVGLAGLKRNKLESDVARGKDFIKANEPKEVKPTAMDRLKSAVGKVKSWAEKFKTNDKPVGLSNLRAEKEDRIKRAAEWGTSPKAEASKAQEQPKAEASKAKAKKTEGKPKVAKAGVKVEAPKAEVKQEAPKSKTSKPKTAKKSTKVEAEKIKPVAKKSKKKTTTSKLNQASSKIAKAVQPEKEKVTVKRGRKPVNANEAWAELICLLADTNISESALEEIVEMKVNKKAAKKAVERDYKEFTKAADNLQRAERNAALTGVPVDNETMDELSKDAQKKGERYERFKSLAQKKYGLEL